MTKKVFIGLADIASFIDDWGEGFKQNNIETLKGSISLQSPVQNSELDFVIQKVQDRIGYFKPGRISIRFKPWWNKMVQNYFLKKAVKECDIFIFIWQSFKNDYSDYKYLKEKNKKIITLFVGDDTRWFEAAKQELSLINLSPIEYKDYDYSTIALNEKLRHLRIAEKYSDIILSQPNNSQLFLRPYRNINLPIIAENYSENKQQRAIPLLVHAPTSIGKGTHYIEPIIKQLKEKGLSFEYQRIQNLPREKALEIYRNADIIIDQLLTPGGGKLAHEGLALGKVVLTLMAYDSYDQKKSKDCPLVDVNADTLYNVLNDLIPDQLKRTHIAAKGRPYIEKYHNPKTIVNDLLEHLNSDILIESDFYPDFYRNRFIPESEEATRVYNKWNEYVSDCDWYGKYIEPGERSGLKF